MKAKITPILQYHRTVYAYEATLHTKDVSQEFYDFLFELDYEFDCVEESQEKGYDRAESIYAINMFETKQEFMKGVRRDVKKALELCRE